MKKNIGILLDIYDDKTWMKLWIKVWFDFAKRKFPFECENTLFPLILHIFFFSSVIVLLRCDIKTTGTIVGESVCDASHCDTILKLSCECHDHAPNIGDCALCSCDHVPEYWTHLHCPGKLLLRCNHSLNCVLTHACRFGCNDLFFL